MRRLLPPGLRAVHSAPILLLAAAPAARACPVCYGDPQSPVQAGMNGAIFVMLGVTYFVVGGMVALFFLLRHRARKRAAASASLETPLP